MWITQLLGIRSGPPLGSHVWILIAIFQLAMDFIICESGSPGKAYKHLQQSSLVHRIHKVALWSPKEILKLRNQKHYWNPINYAPVLPIERKHYKTYNKDHANSIFSRNVPLKYSTTENSHYSSQQIKHTVKMTNLNRSKRQLQSRSWDNLKRFLDNKSQPTTVSEFILWGPTGDDDIVESSTFPGIYETTKTSTVQARTTLLETTTTTASTTINAKATTLQNPGIHRKNAPGRFSTTDPSPVSGKTARPPRIPNETSGLAVHQIITITVSLIMVIAALITTLVLKNCCAQSGNARRNSHQRKINQQEESCQNLTDFTPASVPSNMDIFTAYNETLHCSHECIRTPVPVYTDEALHQTGAFKTTFNGNRIPLVNL